MSDGHKHRWGYDSGQPEVAGPNEWPKHYKVGKHQSPIDITVCDCLLLPVGGRDRDREPLQNLHTCCLSNNQLNSLSSSLETKVRIDAYESSNKHGSQHQQRQQQHSRQHLTTADNDPEDRRRSQSSSSRSSADSAIQQLMLNNEDKASCYPNQRTRYCFTNKKIFIGYPRYIEAVPLCNTGHSWQINIPADLSVHTCK